MIEHLSIERFKCFRKINLPMRRLTMLTGLNGAGKTSIIQALLLAKLAAARSTTIALNGAYGLALGETGDVLTLDSEPSEKICIALREDGGTYRWEFGTGDPGDRQTYLSVQASPKESPPALSSAFAYLCAERLGPRDTLLASSDAGGELGVGHAGQFTAEVLYQWPKSSLVPERRRHPGQTAAIQLYDLHHQTEWWIGEIVREIEIETEWYAGTNALSLRFRSRGFRSEWTRPANTGFGLSYALPVVVAGLTTPSDGMLVVENPEAHLHPAGQSAIGAFLARVAGDGVQVVVETHSDHVINGARRAVGEHKLIEAQDTIVHYFSMGAQGIPDVQTIDITQSGNLTKWPKGFFDQIEIDLAALASIRRKQK